MEINATQFVGFCVILVAGVVMIANITASANTDRLNNYTLNFTGNPHDGDIINLDGQVFEFDNNNAINQGNIPVVIESDINGTTTNLNHAITNNTGLIVL